MRTGDGNSVIGRVARILDAFHRHGGESTVTEVSRRTGIPLTTCHRLLAALSEEGILERKDSRWQVGLRLWEIASHTPRAVEIQQLALPFMHDLLKVTAHPVHLAVRDGGEAVFIERLSTSENSPARPVVGSRYPLHVTAVGLALLAHADSECQEDFLARPLRRFTTHTQTDPQALRRTLAEVRARGFAIADRQVVSTAVSVAAPIRDEDDRVIAAISVNVPRALRHESSLSHAVQTVAWSITRMRSASASGM